MRNFYFQKCQHFMPFFDTTFVGPNFFYLLSFIWSFRNRLFFYIINCSLHELLPNVQDKYFCCALFAFFYQFDSNLASQSCSLFLFFLFCFRPMCLHSKFTFVEICLFISACSYGWEISLDFFAVFSFFSFPFYCFAWAWAEWKEWKTCANNNMRSTK